jgi:hypothetical protein
LPGEAGLSRLYEDQKDSREFLDKHPIGLYTYTITEEVRELTQHPVQKKP